MGQLMGTKSLSVYVCVGGQLWAVTFLCVWILFQNANYSIAVTVNFVADSDSNNYGHFCCILLTFPRSVSVAFDQFLWSQLSQTKTN